MKRGKKMLMNTILLTGTALVMRSVGMAFQVYLSNKIGAAGIGLFQLIMSVSMLAATFSISGSRFATTRLVSEELGRSNNDGVKAAVRRCLIYAFCFGMAAAFLLYFGANLIGLTWIRDARTVLSLKLLALSLPAFSMSAVLSGYFTAVTRVIKSAAVQVIEQLVRIGVVVAALSLATNYTVETACAIIVAGGVAGEMASFLLLFVLYLHDRRRYVSHHQKTTDITKRLLNIALPLALSAYARTALSTLENLLVPRGFKKSGASNEKALADYGMIQGMVFPIITFPSAFFYSLAELIVPELTEAQVNGRTREIRDIVGRILYMCILFSFGVTAVMFWFSDVLGISVYKSDAVGHYIRLLALLMPVIFMDSVTDGMLRGLGQQMYSMFYNILDSFISVILVYYMLPKFAVIGYIIMIYFTDIFNFTLSIRRLRAVAKFRLPVKNILKAAVCAVGAVNIAVLLLRVVGLPLAAGGLTLTVHIILSLLIYLLLLAVFRCVGRSDIKWLRSMMDMKTGVS
ncbi:stage V sporulation protein B [Sporobacter termitidis DSM 10068]|uniref:Stage V sporulation protein B n=1 Tax=Sporobacter termitidis DSM 10068 TaxID=1123282 RepID=A0A1M5TVL7_9FIRM|nr:oligosaccharide flippase family protein [Sporobacter termitidis]SHH54832.1 stage V sporulation protein B [Sporobacter termitidis DSM 10068]